MTGLLIWIGVMTTLNFLALCTINSAMQEALKALKAWMKI